MCLDASQWMYTNVSFSPPKVPLCVFDSKKFLEKKNDTQEHFSTNKEE